MSKPNTETTTDLAIGMMADAEPGNNNGEDDPDEADALVDRGSLRWRRAATTPTCTPLSGTGSPKQPDLIKRSPATAQGVDGAGVFTAPGTPR